MTKTDFIRSIADKAGLTVAQATAAYNAYVDTVTETLKAGDKIQLVGFGAYEVKDVAAKTGINPATGEKVEIAACKTPQLKFGKSFKDIFNA